MNINEVEGKEAMNSEGLLSIGHDEAWNMVVNNLLAKGANC